MSSPCPLPSSHAEAAVGSPAPYRRRRPEQTIAYQVVQQHLESWLAAHREANPDDDPIPSDVERDLRNYLDCGILAHGFCLARCTACGHDFLIAYSCQGRGICSSCNTRRMAETAAHLVDHVFPAVPVRQWVVLLPKRLRYFLARDARLLNGGGAYCVERDGTSHSRPQPGRAGGVGQRRGGFHSSCLPGAWKSVATTTCVPISARRPASSGCAQRRTCRTLMSTAPGLLVFIP